MADDPAWQQISAVVVADAADHLSDALMAHGALAVTLEDAADQPLFEPQPGTTPLWRATRVQGLFDGGVDFETLAAALGAELDLPAAAWRVEPLADRAWERVWMERFWPMRFGRKLWICPTHREVPPEAEVVVRLDPGLAFGTGTHPTTALCLEALDALELTGTEVLDYGCGSGVLAIAALKLGARLATAVDIDEQALLATRDNAARNGVRDALVSAAPGSLRAASADVIVANILAAPLVELAPVLARAARPGAALVLSGILARQAGTVSSAYEATFRMAAPAERDGWVCLSGRRHA